MAFVRGEITVKPHVQALADALQIEGLASSFGTYIGHSPPEGPTQAIDIFTSDDSRGWNQQDRVCDYIKDNAKRFGCRYWIRREHIYNVERADAGWRRQTYKGNRTADHYDHVHVTCYATVPDFPSVPTGPKELLEMNFTYIYNGEDWLFLSSLEYYGKLPFGQTLDGLKKAKLVHDFGTMSNEFHAGVAALAYQARLTGIG